MGSASPYAGWSVGWPAPTAWLIVGGCVVLAWRRRAKLERLCPPAARLLLAELLAELGVSDARASEVQPALIAELNQRISDVAFELGVLPATYTALIRICLASGTGLSLFGFMGSADSGLAPRALRGFVCALSGFVGAGVVTGIGRSARQRVVEIREAWDRSSRELGAALGPARVRDGAGAD